MTPVPRPARGTRPLIAPGELQRLRGSSAPPVLLDVRWALATGPDRAAFDTAHIPGARFVDLDADLAAPPGAAGRHPLPSADVFAESMRAAGVNADSAVVVYDAGPATAAARAWWLLRHFGHRDVRVLDGGLARWEAAGRAVESTTSAPGRADAAGAGRAAVVRGDFQAGPAPATGPGAVLEVDDVLDFARTGVLIDARAPERYRGESEPVDPVAGHIPGAVNRPTTENLRADGTFADPEELRRRFGEFLAETGTAAPAVAAYCGSGITAAHQVLALEVAGIPARLFPGSWSQWVSDPARPVATGGR